MEQNSKFQNIGTKMRNKLSFIVISLIASLILINCSEVKDDITEPEELQGVHPEGFGKFGSENFHSVKIQADNWDMTGCMKCHAADYSGGLTGVSCLDCHTSNAGPEACNTCHGSFADGTKIAPPTDLSNNSSTSAKGVGAHTVHIYENNLSLPLSCGECHPGNESGSSNYVSAHIDGLPAEMLFGDIASSGPSSPSYDYSNINCSNTYCHGNFVFYKDESENGFAYSDSVIVGNNFTPVWNIVDGSQGQCGTCHGEIDNDGNLVTPQPTGHFGNFSIDMCVNCHSSTFNFYNSSDDFEINTSNHINGQVNLD